MIFFQIKSGFDVTNIKRKQNNILENDIYSFYIYLINWIKKLFLTKVLEFMKIVKINNFLSLKFFEFLTN